MKSVRTNDEIDLKIISVQEKIKQINEERDKQIQKPFFDRSFRICCFLDLELKRHADVLKILKWVINEEA